MRRRAGARPPPPARTTARLAGTARAPPPPPGARRQSRPRPRPDRAERPRLRRADESGAPPPQVDVPVGPRAAGVRGRAELADEAQLLQAGLELRPEPAPLDPLQRAERRLDRRTL